MSLIEAAPPRGPLAAIEARRGDYYLTLDDAASITAISKRTLRREIARGNLTAVRHSARCVRILASELTRYMGKGESAAASKSRQMEQP